MIDYAEIAFKILNCILKVKPQQAITISAEIHNVSEYDDPLIEIPFLEELALFIRKAKALPIIDVSTENLHKRFFEEITDDSIDISTEQFFKWINSSELFIDLSWRSNPQFYQSIADRSYKRVKMSSKEFIRIFSDNNKKLLLLGFPTKGLSIYYKVDHQLIEKTYFEALNLDYNELKKRVLIFDGKIKKSQKWYLDTDKRTVEIEFEHDSLCMYGDFNDEVIVTLPCGSWEQDIIQERFKGIFLADSIYFDHHRWHDVQIIFENGKVTDVETVSDLEDINLLKTLLFQKISGISLQVGLNKNIIEKTNYSLFDMRKHKNVSLIMNNSRGQLIALSHNASLHESKEKNILEEV
ncbi:MAG: hypothetical protein PHY08_03720 [Candidatus Cloacimonetes bacterium]|nr:hypothetical protein [Candidatus Cloacimonadota bacterium]